MDQVAEFLKQVGVCLKLFGVKESQEDHIDRIYQGIAPTKGSAINKNIHHRRLPKDLLFPRLQNVNSNPQPSPSHKLPNILHHIAPTLHINHLQMAKVRLGH